MSETHTVLSSGYKADDNKQRYDLIPADALDEMVKVLSFGAKKYEDRNWERGIKYGRVFAALMRHAWAWWNRETHDPETGIHHLAHAACCVFFLLSYELRKMRAFDNRPEPITPIPKEVNDAPSQPMRTPAAAPVRSTTNPDRWPSKKYSTAQRPTNNGTTRANV